MRHNRALWDELAAGTPADLAERQWREPGPRWGLFRQPEARLGALGPLAGRRVVELACGTAALSAAMRREGAHVVALDVSAGQLATARRLQQRVGPGFPLVQADAEAVPLMTGCADLVASEHGVAAWCDPDSWLPEARRLLRAGGRLAFLTNSHVSALTVPEQEGPAGDRLLRGPAEVERVAWPGGGHEFHPSHGSWVRLLRHHGFVVEALHELYAPDDAPELSDYGLVTGRWARRWPAEEMWVATAS